MTFGSVHFIKLEHSTNKYLISNLGRLALLAREASFFFPFWLSVSSLSLLLGGTHGEYMPLVCVCVKCEHV